MQTYTCTHISTSHNDLIQFDVLLHSLSAKSIRVCLKAFSKGNLLNVWLQLPFTLIILRQHNNMNGSQNKGDSILLSRHLP